MARLSQGNRTEQRVLSYEGYPRNASCALNLISTCLLSKQSWSVSSQ